ncbi:hypothetical protein MPER_07031 [Moniliophthora perniciosa FA553]|nr:hypothetical protein MPER_07031 [Moniliophthora perniciosa FA553]
MSSSTSSSTAEERDPPAPAHKPIVIKDFAYKSDDPRMKGLGIDVPRPNRVTVLNKKLMGQLEYKSWKRQAGFSNTSDDDDDDDSETETETEMEEDDASWGGSGAGGMGAFRFGLGRFSWGGGTSASGSSTQATSAGFPTRGDLEMNFTPGG